MMQRRFFIVSLHHIAVVVIFKPQYDSSRNADNDFRHDRSRRSARIFRRFRMECCISSDIDAALNGGGLGGTRTRNQRLKRALLYH